MFDSIKLNERTNKMHSAIEKLEPIIIIIVRDRCYECDLCKRLCRCCFCSIIDRPFFSFVFVFFFLLLCVRPIIKNRRVRVFVKPIFFFFFFVRSFVVFLFFFSLFFFFFSNSFFPSSISLLSAIDRFDTNR